MTRHHPRLFTRNESVRPSKITGTICATVPSILSRFFLASQTSLVRRRVFRCATLLPHRDGNLAIRDDGTTTNIRTRPSTTRASILLGGFTPNRTTRPNFRFYGIGKLKGMVIHPNVRPLRFVYSFATYQRSRRANLGIIPTRNTRRLRSIRLKRIRIRRCGIMPLYYRYLRHNLTIYANVRLMPKRPRLSNGVLPRKILILCRRGTRLYFPPFPWGLHFFFVVASCDEQYWSSHWSFLDESFVARNMC